MIFQAGDRVVVRYLPEHNPDRYGVVERVRPAGLGMRGQIVEVRMDDLIHQHNAWRKTESYHSDWIHPAEIQQRQDSVSDQMKTVMILAVEAGCYDAHDWLLRNFPMTNA